MVSQLLRRDALNNFKLLLDQRASGSLNPHPIAVMLAIFARPFERYLRSLKRDMCIEIFESTIEQLEVAWLDGKPPLALKDYMKVIEDSACDPTLDPLTRLRGRSAAAVMKYILGDLRDSHELGARNWAEARRLESDEESEMKWIASYGYFDATLFLGDFRKAMNLMADQWGWYYAPLDNSLERATDHASTMPISAVHVAVRYSLILIILTGSSVSVHILLA